jgi:hypothetical protein
MAKKTYVDKQLYYEFEHLVINWCNDGTKTAGSLVRDIILKMLEMGYDKVELETEN